MRLFFLHLIKKKNLISFVNTVTGDLKRDLILTVEENQHFNEIWQKLNTEMLKLKTILIKTDENGILSSLNEADGLGITPLLLCKLCMVFLKQIQKIWTRIFILILPWENSLKCKIICFFSPNWL